MLLKLQTSAITLGIILSLTIVLTAQRQTSQARIKCVAKSDACECRIENNRELLLDLAKSKRKDLSPKYFVLWEFDDGNYLIERGDKTVTNTYNTGKTYTVKASFIVQYSDYAIPSQERSVTILKEGVSKPPPSVFKLMAGLPKDVRKEMRGNDEMVIIAEFPKEGNMTLEYDANMSLSPQPIRGHLGARILSNTGTVATIQSDKAQRVFIYFKTKTFATTQSNKSEKAKVVASFEGKPYKIDFDKVDALDPNKLTVKPRKLRYEPFEKTKHAYFSYRLQFENEGAETAKKIRMEVAIPAGMRVDPDSIKDWRFNCGSLQAKDCPVYYKKFPEGDESSRSFLYVDLSKQEQENRLTFTFFNVDLKGEEFDDEELRCGEINYQLVRRHFVKNKTQVSHADIFFNENPAPTPTTTRTRFRLDPRLGIRGAYQLPAVAGEKAIYELGLFLSGNRPDKVYFPIEIGIAANEREFSSASNLIKLRPLRLAVQARKNWRNLLAYGLGVGADFVTNVRSENTSFTLLNQAFAYSNMQIFGDIGFLNTRNGGLGFGARAGFPFSLNEKFQIPKKFNLQAYVQYKF